MLKYTQKRELIMWIFVMIVGILDLFTTYIGLNNNLAEQNPVGDYLIMNTGFYSIIIMKFLIIYFCYVLSQRLMYGKWHYLTPLILFIIWSIVSLNNIYYIIFYT